MSVGCCRDCEEILPKKVDRCPACASPRVLFHKELAELDLAHVDCDAFYAAVEKRDNKDLIDKPVIIGGGRRGVVSTACYNARVYGVRSAMPMFKALQACPHAVVVKPDMEKYSRVGKEVREMMQALSPLVEPISIDEAFIDLSGTERLHGRLAAASLVHFANRVEKEIGITISVGLSHNKFLAKVASDLDKPRGFSVIGREETLSFLRPQPVSLIWGVGKAFKKKLNNDGFHTIEDLQRADETDLAKRYGVMGQRLARLSRGDDARQVSRDGAAKSVSSETTFNEDIADLRKLTQILRRLSEKVSKRLKASDIAGKTVTLKLKTSDFRSQTRNRRLNEPTQLADKIFTTALELLQDSAKGRKFRLIGVGVMDLCDPDFADRPDLVDLDGQKRADAERAMDRIRQKFGGDAVKLGLLIDEGSGQSSPQRDQD